ncbi:hypothetical protein ALO98_200160 [Pseudomonas syringae pv. tagetis]|nr:hypothetical protein ALO98_200160 [Pseudomonas syringae pv. tagetis]
MQSFYIVERGLDSVKMFIPTISCSTYTCGSMRKKTLQKLKVIKKKIIPSSAITEQVRMDLTSLGHQVGFLACAGGRRWITYNDKLSSTYNTSCYMRIENVEFSFGIPRKPGIRLQGFEGLGSSVDERLNFGHFLASRIYLVADPIPSPGYITAGRAIAALLQGISGFYTSIVELYNFDWYA